MRKLGTKLRCSSTKAHKDVQRFATCSLLKVAAIAAKARITCLGLTPSSF
jgi:hypothetical protein